MKTSSCNDPLSVRRMKRWIVIGLFLLGLLSPGCSEKQQPPPPPVQQGKVVIKGSNTIGEEMGPRLIAEYKKDHPTAELVLESKGTASGFTALLAGESDIAAASRVVTQEELNLARSRGDDVNVYVIGSYSVAVVLNAANHITNLSRDQVRDIFTGAVQNWKEVGGSDAPVHLYIRDPISGTYLGFRELAMEDKPYAANPKTFTNYDGIVQAVAQDQNGIGNSSFEPANKAGVKALPIRGVAPNTLSVNEGRYPFSRVLRLYTNKAKESPPALDFIRFIESPSGQEIVAQMGNVPRP